MQETVLAGRRWPVTWTRFQSWAQNTGTFGAKVTTEQLQAQCPHWWQILLRNFKQNPEKKGTCGFRSKLLRNVETACQGDDLFPFDRLSQWDVCSAVLSEAAWQSPLQQGLDDQTPAWPNPLPASHEARSGRSGTKDMFLTQAVLDLH